MSVLDLQDVADDGVGGEGNHEIPLCLLEGVRVFVPEEPLVESPRIDIQYEGGFF